MSKHAALIAAIKAQNIHKVAELLNDDNINLPDEHSHTPLYWAARHGNLEICKLLIQHGATESINLADWSGHTPLYCAANHGNLEICKLLIKHGVNCKDVSLPSKLFNNLEGDAAATLAVKILNQNGTLPDGIEITPEDLILQVVIMGAEVVFDKIVAENNDILSIAASDAEYPLLLLENAYQSGNHKIFQHITTHYDDAEHLDALNQILTEMGYHSAHTMQDALNLFIAASAVEEETVADHVVDIILEHGKDIDYNDAFVTAIMNGCLSIAQQIFAHGVDLNEKVRDLTVLQHLNIYQTIDEELYNAIIPQADKVIKARAEEAYGKYTHGYSIAQAEVASQLLGLKQVAEELTLQLEHNGYEMVTMGEGSTIMAGAGLGVVPDPAMQDVIAG